MQSKNRSGKKSGAELVNLVLLQCCSRADPQDSCEHILQLLEGLSDPASPRPDGLILPEIANMVAGKKALNNNAYDFLADPLLLALMRFARDNSVWVLLGSILVREDAALRNRSVFINNSGEIKATYDKIHMFDVDFRGEQWRESDSFAAGSEAVLLEADTFKLGLSICYDLRQPKLYRDLALAGAEILAVPAAFTVPTGKLHWHTLLRARAIENAAFVVAPAQAGLHQDGRSTYGHSLVVDPLGRIIAEATNDSPQLLRASLDLKEVAQARAEIPALNAMRDYKVKRRQV